MHERPFCEVLRYFRVCFLFETLVLPSIHALVQEAIRYYEPIVKKQADTILEVPAIVLANLCVSHIMISQNEEAEELMRKVGVLFSCGFNCSNILRIHHCLRMKRCLVYTLGSCGQMTRSCCRSFNVAVSPLGLMQIEKEEEKVAQQDPDKQCFHLCIVNLVIGTLYCAKVRKLCGFVNDNVRYPFP